jgi:septum formation protein
VLAVDTIVVIDGDILGKAAGEEEALAFLRRLNGRSHDVVSGLCLRLGERRQVTHAVTSVTFCHAGEDELKRYVACGEWRERAGAYAVQGLGSALVASVHGDYFNVVGLPVAVFALALREVGLPAFAWDTSPA